jgi:hypothetical protein
MCRKTAENRVTAPDRMREVSRGHSSRRKRAVPFEEKDYHGGLTPMKA